MLKVTRQHDRIVVTDVHSGETSARDIWDLIKLFAVMMTIALAVDFGLPIALGQPSGNTVGLGPLLVVCAVMFAIATVAMLVAAPFDSGIETTFDLPAKTVTHRRVLRLRAYELDLRRARTMIAFADVPGIGLREVQVEAGFEYQAVLVAGERELPLARRRGSYLGQNERLDIIRISTGMPKWDLPRPHASSEPSAAPTLARDRF